ncbi:MAG: LamG-like jellyroll fold domain-containing protein [Planctomycetota bacterium]
MFRSRQSLGLLFVAMFGVCALGGNALDAQILTNGAGSNPTLTIDDVSFAEGDLGFTSFVFTVSLDMMSSSTISVTYSTSNGTATGGPIATGADYLSSANSILISPGETTATIVVDVVGDSEPEGNETFFVNITSATNASIGDGQGLGTIQDDDFAVTCPATQQLALGIGCSALLGDYRLLVGANVAATDVTLTQTPPPLTMVTGVGPISVTIDAVTTLGVTSSCTFMVDLVDVAAPQITCPADVTVSVPSVGTSVTNATGLFVPVPLVTATDNCGGMISIDNDYNLNGPNASDRYPVGTTTVNVTATDAGGNSSSCSFDVTVIGQPTDLFYTGTSSGANGTQVTWSAVLLDTDIAAAANTFGNPVPGQQLHFMVDGQSQTGITDASGVATVNVTLNQAPGMKTMAVTFGGGGVYAASTSMTPYEVTAGPRISVASAPTLPEGASGTTTGYPFSVSLETSSIFPVSVDLATVDGTAVSGVDYIATMGTITIPAGDLVAFSQVEVMGDDDWEPSETFDVVLSNPVNGRFEELMAAQQTNFLPVPAPEATAVIINDDQLVIDCPDPFAEVADAACLAMLPDVTTLVTLPTTACTFTVTQMPPPASPMSAGGTTVAVTVVANCPGIAVGSGAAANVIQDINTAMCTVDVGLVDVTGPMMTCIPSVTAPMDPTMGGALISLPTTAFDNCDGPLLVSNDIPPAPGGVNPLLGDTHFFPPGITTVTWSSVDSSGITGTCTTEVTVLAQNDNPCGAIPLSFDVLQPFDTGAATAAPGEVTPGAGSGTDSCNATDGWCSFETEVDASLWYTFIAPPSGCISVETITASGSSSDTQLAVYGVGDCADFSTFTELAGNDDSGAGFAAKIDTLLGLTPGATYYVQLDSFGNTTPKMGDVLLTDCGRVDDCLLVLYDFTEGGGNTVNDSNGTMTPINLTIDNLANVTWLPNRGLVVNTPTIITSLVPATRVIDACVASNELTIEAWVRPNNTTQGGPARIVSLGENGWPIGGNAIIGQEGNDYRTRARTTDTAQYGKPELSSSSADTTQLQHVVFTRDAAGQEHLYVDNVVVDSSITKLGDFLGSWEQYALTLANEPGLTPNGDGRPWLGEFQLVALYKKALSMAEVDQNFNAGIGLAPVITTQPVDVTVNAGEDATFTITAIGTPPLSYQWQTTGAVTNGSFSDLPGENGPSLTITNTNFGDNGDMFRCVVTNSEGVANSNSATLFVIPPPPPSAILTVVPMQQTVQQGDDATLAINVFNDGVSPLFLVNISSTEMCSSLTVVGGGDPYSEPLNPGETLSMVCLIEDVQTSFCTEISVMFLTQAMLTNGPLVSETAQACVDVDMTPPTPTRITDCLLVLYRFLEGSGSQVADLSGELPPIDLTIDNPGAVSWIPTGGLTVNTPTVISSLLPAQRIVDACTVTNELTIEAWIQPANTTQAGPARIVTLSQNPWPDGGNATLGQEGEDYRTRARTTTTDQYGKPELSADSVDTTQPQHVVFTRDGSGTERLYVNSLLVAGPTPKTGTFASAWGNYPLALANEPALAPNGTDRPWLGDLLLVAMYEKALAQGGVIQNYLAGLDLPPPPPSGPTILANPTNTRVTEGDDALFSVIATGSGMLTYEWQELISTVWTPIPSTNSPTFVVTSTILSDSGRTFRCAVTDDNGTTESTSASLTVNAAPVAAMEITLDPENAVVQLGDSLNVTATVTNTGELPITLFQLTANGPPAEYCGALEVFNGVGPLAVGQSRVFDVCFQGLTADLTYELVATGIVDEPGGANVQATKSGTITVLPPGRVTDGLIALYEFLEGQGDVVQDTSGFAPPLDLNVEPAGSINWFPNGGVEIYQPTRIVSPGPASKIVTRCQTTQEVTLEVWLQALDNMQTGPGRLLSLSGNGFPIGGNFILGQDGEQFASRCRSTLSDVYGRPELRTPTTLFDNLQLHHLVFTRDSAGNQKLYFDGVEVADQVVAGTFANWGPYRLCLANEAEPTTGGFFRPWLGDLHLVAIYDRALSESEVLVNRNAGVPAGF